jgi:hypothetical protein
LGILGSQIEMECIFNICGMITSLKLCQDGVENFSMLVVIQKKKPNEAMCNCLLVDKGVGDFLVAEDSFLEQCEDEVQKLELIVEQSMLVWEKNNTMYGIKASMLQTIFLNVGVLM